ncbi:MAG: riboflavin kinase, partial [Bacteroidia bacterium]
TVDGTSYSIEVHIFDFNEYVYYHEISIEYIEKMRNEIHFDTIHSLQFQLEKDKLHATKILSPSH